MGFLFPDKDRDDPADGDVAGGGPPNVRSWTQRIIFAPIEIDLAFEEATAGVADLISDGAELIVELRVEDPGAGSFAEEGIVAMHGDGFAVEESVVSIP